MDRRRLVFTLATYVGALKARYAQWWSPLFLLLNMTKLTVFVAPFIWPWYRATIYSGDRIAYACCGDPDVSLDAVYRALVGKDMAARLRADGVLRLCRRRSYRDLGGDGQRHPGRGQRPGLDDRRAPRLVADGGARLAMNPCGAGT